jgi:hypothetical protein
MPAHAEQVLPISSGAFFCQYIFYAFFESADNEDGYIAK